MSINSVNDDSQRIFIYNMIITTPPKATAGQMGVNDDSQYIFVHNMVIATINSANYDSPHICQTDAYRIVSETLISDN